MRIIEFDNDEQQYILDLTHTHAHVSDSTMAWSYHSDTIVVSHYINVENMNEPYNIGLNSIVIERDDNE